MSNNEINITLNISDELLAKLIMAVKPQSQSMGIPLQALMGMAMPPQALPKEDKPKAKSAVGFKIDGGAE
tara:strand:- start:49 stop:258 length:210 start_codon:yes stop_codon:yes gene_type:complete